MKTKRPEKILKRLMSGTGRTLSVAESCTGGMISHLITTVPGSSEYYLGSVTSYSPEIKAKVLKVSPSVISRNGIVSSVVAEAMAKGVRELTGSTFSVSTTGWADSYGDEREPAGTVWIGISGPKDTFSVKFQNSGSRKQNINQFADYALTKLVEFISDNI